MDWIRRNWPDFLIGLALLAVIAGIIATLLNGGSFFPFGQSSNTTQPDVSTPQTTTAPADPQAEAATEGGDGDALGDGNAVTPIAPGEDAIEATSDAVTPVAPGADADSGAANDDASDGAATPTSTTAGATTADAAGAAAPSSGGAFRIGVGSYSQPENAERRAEAFRDEDYPVFTAQQGQYTVVLVGPYESRSEAEEVLARIQNSGLESEPILYQLEPGAAETTTSTTIGGADDGATASITGGTTSAADSATSTASDAEGSYIQVGAYNSSEQAEPQLEQIGELGFDAILREDPASAFVKVWVGPFADERLESVQEQLSELGIENFVPAQ